MPRTTKATAPKTSSKPAKAKAAARAKPAAAAPKAKPPTKAKAKAAAPPKPAPKIAAFRIGVLDHQKALILGEAAVPVGAEVTLGSEEGTTLAIPAEYGIERRTVIRAGAMVFEPTESLAAHHPRGWKAIDLPSPVLITTGMMLEMARLKLLVSPVWAVMGQLGVQG